MRRREGSFVLFSLSSLRSFVHRLDGMKLVFFSLSQVFEVTSGDRILLESLAAILTLFYLLFPSTSSYWLGKRTTDWQIGCGPRLGAMRFIIGHLLLCDYRSAFMKKRKWRKKKPSPEEGDTQLGNQSIRIFALVSGHHFPSCVWW